MLKINRLLAWLLLAVILCSSFSGCDKKEPDGEVEFQNLIWAVGAPLPTAQDFAVSLPDGYTVKFAEEYTFSSLGDYTLRIIATDARGHERTHEVKFTLMMDEEPPVISGAQDIVAYVGDGISYRGGVSAADNCGGNVTLQVDSSAVDSSKEGEYPVVYTATDAAGNVSTVKVMVYIYREQVTSDMLYALLDPIIAANIPSGTSREQQARAVYSYVYYHIDYDAYSDKSDWVRAAYEGLRTGKGDCFTYFALSKAFFERLGIENMDIQRTAGIVDERHYWNYVNIGTSAEPRWYHFDACQLSGMQHSGCLLTDVQVGAYTRYRADENGVTGYFYAYDSSKYPASATAIITSTPSLEPYY